MQRVLGLRYASPTYGALNLGVPAMIVLVDLSIYTAERAIAFGTSRLEFDICPSAGDQISLVAREGFEELAQIRDFDPQPKVSHRILTPGAGETPMLILEDMTFGSVQDAEKVVHYLIRAFSFDMELATDVE